MRRNDWPVGPNAIRPSGPQDRCFYCNEEKEHKKDCVLVKRTVIVKVEIELAVTVPNKWTEEDITGFYGEINCANNTLIRIKRLNDRLDKASMCACQITQCKYLREATEEDEANQLLYVNEIKS